MVFSDGPSRPGLACRFPGLLDQGCRAGDAPNIVRLALVDGPLQHAGDRLGFDGGIVQGLIIVAGRQERTGQVPQSHVDMCPRFPHMRLGAGEQDSHIASFPLTAYAIADSVTHHEKLYHGLDKNSSIAQATYRLTRSVNMNSCR
jgi:hypothetical protein